MDYIKIRFVNDFDRMGSRFDETIAEMFQSMHPMFSLARSSWKPPLDVYETADEIFIIVELAGIDKEDLQLEINTRAMRIAGKRPGKQPAPKGRYRLAEIQHGTFERVLYLPVPVDTEKVNASYKKGLLHIRIAKLVVESRQDIPITGE